MFGQDLANFLIQPVFDADFVLHGRTHALGQRGYGWRFDFHHFGRQQAFDQFARYVAHIIPRQQHREVPSRIRKSSLLSRAKGCQGRFAHAGGSSIPLAMASSWPRNRQSGAGPAAGAIAGAIAGYPSGSSSIIVIGPMLTRNIPASGEALPVIGVGTYRGFDVPSSGNSYAAVGEVLR